jgi:hypothetical protein
VQMKLGEKARLDITSDFAYGSQEFPGLIPPHSDLILYVLSACLCLLWASANVSTARSSSGRSTRRRPLCIAGTCILLDIMLSSEQGCCKHPAVLVENIVSRHCRGLPFAN